MLKRNLAYFGSIFVLLTAFATDYGDGQTRPKPAARTSGESQRIALAESIESDYDKNDQDPNVACVVRADGPQATTLFTSCPGFNQDTANEQFMFTRGEAVTLGLAGFTRSISTNGKQYWVSRIDTKEYYCFGGPYNKVPDEKAMLLHDRQWYATILTHRMSDEIPWLATGPEGKLLAGYVDRRVSANTQQMITLGSPLWNQMYKLGFRIVDIADKMIYEHAMTLTPHGASAQVSESLVQGAYFGKAFTLLMYAANGRSQYPIPDPDDTLLRPAVCPHADYSPVDVRGCLTEDELKTSR